MIPKVLIVDDSQEMLFALNEGLEKYENQFTVLLSSDGTDAVKKLMRNTVSVVVTDLKMPEMDGFSLLTHIMEQYPGIPVIVITGYSTPQMEMLAKDGGAIGYIEKPFMIDHLADKILKTLRAQSDGGSLQNVTSSMFLQLVEMEQKTCTIRLTNRASGHQGVLFFNNGELLDARIGHLSGEKAAYELFSWDEVNLSIQNSCQVTENIIQKDIQAVFLEALRLKDEAEAAAEAEAPPPEPKPKAEPKPEPKPAKKQVSKPAPQKPPVKPKEAPDDEVEALMSAPMKKAEALRKKINARLGAKSGVLKIYADSQWDNMIFQIKKASAALNAGELKLAVVSNKTAQDHILVPDKETIVVAINPKLPRDRIVETLLN